VVNRATDETDTEFFYELPAPTTFDRLAVPSVLETPSPSQTFTRLVEVYGASQGPEGPYELLASATLQTHQGKDQVTELAMQTVTPVRWLKLRLVGGIEILRDQMFLEFGEIIGNGTQETPDLDTDRFTGSWWDRGVRLTLVQDGATVTGCYDRGAEVSGTVIGNLLRAIGTSTSGIVSHFVLGVTSDGIVRGVRSSNGAPFRLYSGATSTDRTVECEAADGPPLGCGSIIHGLEFAFNSDELQPGVIPILDALADGLRSELNGVITIEGHTSSEGPEDYNLNLSDRRARAVVVGLGLRGISADRLNPIGIGEARPIATNTDESGRAMNRRVEVRCG